MAGKFDYFIVFAEMRTGSNFLEENLNKFKDLNCLGEMFNPHFMGYPDQDAFMGYTQGTRDEDPAKVIKAIRDDTDNLSGFRFFHDHDTRVFEKCIKDPRCAKVVLTRNPVDSFVSWKIASATGQWKLTNATHLKSEKVPFNAAEFEGHLTALQKFQVEILNRLQHSGQTAFYVAYEDLQDLDVMNGLAKFLGSQKTLDGLSKKLKKQNPSPMQDKVENFDEMANSLARLDQFNLTRTPNFEPRRGPMIPNYVAAKVAPLLFMPIKSGPDQSIRNWLAALDSTLVSELQQDFSQKSIRQWKRQNKGHRSFTVVCHPVKRAYQAFCDHILGTSPATYSEARKTLRRVHNLPLPEDAPGPDFTLEETRAAFASYLEFVKANLSGQTALRVDSAWASQAQTVQGLAEFGAPDMIVREENLAAELSFLASQVGADFVPPVSEPDAQRHALKDIYNDQIEDLVRDAYQKDYMMFGWVPFKRLKSA